MGNFNEIIKNANELGILLDGCGTDERYYNFGAYIDLCGASPEELMPKCCGDNTSDNKKASNLITSKLMQTPNGWEIVITAQEIVTSSIELELTYTYTSDNEEKRNVETFLLEDNTLNGTYYLSIPENSTNIKIIKAEIYPTSDQNYKYELSTLSDPILYYGVFLHKDISNMLPKDIENMSSIIVKDGENDIEFTIPPIGVEGFNDIENEDDISNIINENTYDLVIACDVAINSYNITDVLGEIDNNFISKGTVHIENHEYTLLIRTDPNSQTNIYDSLIEDGSALTINYSFNVK